MILRKRINHPEQIISSIKLPNPLPGNSAVKTFVETLSILNLPQKTIEDIYEECFLYYTNLARISKEEYKPSESLLLLNTITYLIDNGHIKEALFVMGFIENYSVTDLLQDHRLICSRNFSTPFGRLLHEAYSDILPIDNKLMVFANCNSTQLTAPPRINILVEEDTGFVVKELQEDIVPVVNYFLWLFPKHLLTSKIKVKYNYNTSKRDGAANIRKKTIYLHNTNPATIVHELAHIFELQVSKRIFKKIVSPFVLEFKPLTFIDLDYFPNIHARENLHELWATLIEIYIIHGDVLRTMPVDSPLGKAYVALRKYVFRGIEYTRERGLYPIFLS